MADQMKTLYKELKSINGPDVTNQQVSELAKIIQEHAKKEASEKLDMAAIQEVIRLSARVASEVDFNAFKEFISHGETPPLKLTEAEMNALKGGGFWNVMKWVGIGAVGLFAVGGIRGLATGIGHGAAAVGRGIGAGASAIGGFIWNGGRGGGDKKADDAPVVKPNSGGSSSGGDYI